jgi:hypothetical protein
MAGRKITPKKRKDSRQPLRFMSAEIVRTIEAVQASGLTVYGVEITLAGAINITRTTRAEDERTMRRTLTLASAGSFVMHNTFNLTGIL